MVVENLRIDVTPGGVPLVIHVSQYDAGLRQFVFTPYDKGVAMAKIAGATVAVEATKPDGYAVQHPCTYNNDGTITYTLQEQLAACEGQVWSKLTWRDSNGNILGAKAIVWAVDMAGIEDGAIVSASDLPLIEQAAEFASEYETKVAEMIAEMQIVPGQVVIDGTLTVQGAAADAKATGDRLADLQSAIDEIEPLSDDAKTALLNCFAHVAWIDDDGQDYYDALEAALNPIALVSISVVFTQGQHVVYTDDSLDSLKQYLVVTAHYANQTTATVLGYTLSGTLTVGTSVITVTYEDKTTTFNVTVTASPYIYNYSASSGVNPPDMTGTSFDFSEDPGAVKVLVPNLAIPISSNNWEAEMECKFNYWGQANNPKISVSGYVSDTDNLNIVLQPNPTASSDSDRTKLAYTINWESNTKTFTEYTFTSYRVYRVVYNNGTFNVYLDNNLIVSSGKIDSSKHVDANAFKIVCASSSRSTGIYIKTLKVKTL